ncbi:MAG: hypothetical protein V3W18_05825 [candidate division Zixibacteria bacterium]
MTSSYHLVCDIQLLFIDLYNFNGGSKIKPLLISAIIILTTLSVQAGEKTFIQGPLESGFYIGPEAKVCVIFDENEIMAGGRAGWIINHKFAVGAAAYTMVSESSMRRWTDTFPDISMSYGGVLLEYIHNSDKIEHFSLEMIIGIGSISLHEDRFITVHEQDSYFIMEPGANFILNFARFLRVGVGFGYRMAYDIEFGYYDNEDLTGASFRVFGKFGKF